MWRRFTYTFFGTLALGLLAPLLFVLTMDPYGNSPISLGIRQPLPESNQRYIYPQIIRHGDYDSLIIGTSTSRLLEPAKFDATLGGRFANLSMNDARAWEQVQLINISLREKRALKNLFVGLDSVWCREDAATYLHTNNAEFPDWLYDSNPANDLLYALNNTAVYLAYKKLAFHLGRNVTVFEPTGYSDFTGGESKYDLKRAREKIAQSAQRRQPPLRDWGDPESLRLPALDWLSNILEKMPKRSKAFLVFVPVHVAAQPYPGSREDWSERECKRRVIELARKFDATYLDMRTRSELTTNDENFWDSLHWRIHVGRLIVDRIAHEAAKTGAAYQAPQQYP